MDARLLFCIGLEASVCTDPRAPEYDCLRVHPEMYTASTDLVMLCSAEENFLRSRGFEILVDPSTQIDCTHLRGKLIQPYHLLLSQYSEIMGEGGLCVVFGNGVSQPHTSHWHPSVVSKEKLACQIEFDILTTAKHALGQEGGVQLLVSDSSWMPMIDILQSKYGVFPEFIAVKERGRD